MKRWAAATLIVVAILTIAGITIMSASYDAQVATRIYIPKDATKNSIRDSLKLRLGDSFGTMVYRLWSMAAGDPATAHGSYLIEPGQSAVETAHKIKSGRETPVKVTLNNMRTLDDLTKRLGSKIEASPADLKAALNKVLQNDSRFSKPEEFAAAFLPDTYEFYWTDDPEHVIKRLVDDQKAFWNEDRMKKAEKLGLTPVEVTTIASIVESESSKADEYPTIARLYMNRLKKDMKLQSDPTVIFATGNFNIRRVTGKHLKTDSPYNTYKNTGLPPGPIRIPQKSTIDAVLNAPQHNYLFMCAKEDFSGRHNFAVNYAEHKRNAAKYQAQLNKRGIK